MCVQGKREYGVSASAYQLNSIALYDVLLPHP
jgi:hypothetical protein